MNSSGIHKHTCSLVLIFDTGLASSAPVFCLCGTMWNAYLQQQVAWLFFITCQTRRARSQYSFCVCVGLCVGVSFCMDFKLTVYAAQSMTVTASIYLHVLSFACKLSSMCYPGRFVCTYTINQHNNINIT